MHNIIMSKSDSHATISGQMLSRSSPETTELYIKVYIRQINELSPVSTSRVNGPS